MTEKSAFLAALLVAARGFSVLFARALRRERPGWPGKLHLGIGFVTDFLDTLGIGSFATTTSAFRLSKPVDDRLIPGRLTVGHALPTLARKVIQAGFSGRPRSGILSATPVGGCSSST